MENYQKILDLFYGLKPHLYPNTKANSTSNLFDINLVFHNGEFMFVFDIIGKYQNPNILYKLIIDLIDKFYGWYDLDNVRVDIYYNDGSKPETLSYYKMFIMVEKQSHYYGYFDSHPKLNQIREWSRNEDINTYRNLIRHKESLWVSLKSKCLWL